MSPIRTPRPFENTPHNRDKTQSRLRILTRVAVISATGGAAAIGIAVAHAHPGAGNTTAHSVTPSRPGGATTSSSSSSATSGTTGNTGGSSPTTTTTTPVVTSGGTSA